MWTQMGRWRDERDVQLLRNRITRDLTAHRNALGSALANRLALLEGLRAFVEVKLARGERLEDQYAEFASRLYGVARGTRNLGIAEGTVYRLVYPLPGNESVLGYNLLTDPRPEVLADTRRAMTSRALVLSGPITLKQGGDGLIARGTILNQGRFWGLVGIAFDLQPILEEARLLPLDVTMEVAVRRPGSAPFFGAAGVFRSDAVTERVELPDGLWEIAARPAGGWWAPGAEARRLWALSGVVLALVPMTLVFVVTWRQRLTVEAAASAERRVAERTAELSRTNQLLQSILSSSPLPIIMFDGQAIVQVWNRAAEQVFGWTAAEAVGRHNPIVGPDDEREFSELQKRIRAGESLSGVEIRRRRKDGTLADLRLFTARVTDQEGRLTGVMGLVQDVTEQAQMERALRLAMVVVEHSPVVLVRWRGGEGWPVEYISENVRQFGYTRDEFLNGGLLYDAIVVPEDLPRVRRECVEAVERGDTRFAQEYRILTKDGRVRWMEDRTTIVTGQDGSVCYEGIVIDVTERKLVEGERQELQRRLREMLDNVQLIAVMLDPRGRVTFCNQYLEGLSGWTREELTGRDWFETLLPVAVRAQARAEFDERAARGGSNLQYEGTILTKDGRVREITWDNSILRDAAGQVIGLASFGRDVTDQRQLEAQYRHAQKMEAVGQLAGGVAHDFNNLLQVITGYTALALSDLRAEQPLYSELTEIRRAAERATSLVRQLLTFSRRQKIEPRALDINDTIADLLKMLRRLIGEHIELDFEPGYGVKPVLADAGLLEQALMNLCVNARDVMPEGGRLSIATANVTLGREFVEQRGWGREGDYVLLSVTDTGPGIPPELRDRIFEPFFTTKEVGKGTGLGLATVYGIVKQHDGMIEVADEAGRGASFRIYLPLCGSAEERQPPPPATARTPRGHETILLAEDEDLVRSLARRVLESAGYRVLVARDGDEAIALIEAHAGEIDLALLDVVMPRASGREVSARLNLVRPGVPVVFCSGYSRQMLDENWMPDDGVELMLKPYEPKALLERVSARLGRRTEGA
jgi:PAS domain S-box-containing protein